MQANNPPQKELLDVETFLEVYSISRNRFYDEVKKGNIRITKLGFRTLVARKDAEAWLENARQKSVQ